MRTFGVEEELLLVDERSSAPVAIAPRILARPRPADSPALEAELQQEMLEVVGAPSQTADELAEGIARGRRYADVAAQAFGARAVPLATSPLPVHPHPSPSARFDEVMRRYGATARRALTCGFHVHVAVESPEEGVAVLDRIREWLPTVLALTANSPFSDGSDTGYASYRTDLWSRWPCTGPSPVFGSLAAYREHERMLLASDTLIDPGMLYFDARLSRRHPTVEIRVCDVCLREEDAVTVSVLCRGLVEAAAAQWRAGRPPLDTDNRILRLAGWRAALTGIGSDLVDPLTGAARPVRDAIAEMLAYAGPGLAVTGDGELVAVGIERILQRGTGADWQREQVAHTGSIENMIAALARGSLLSAHPAEAAVAGVHGGVNACGANG